jgi:hypothetical protein
LVVVKFEGSVGVQEIAKYAQSLVAHPDFDPSFSEITDLRGVQQFDLQANDFLTLAIPIDPFSLAAKRIRGADLPAKPGCSHAQVLVVSSNH